jgi:hypothetical protein
VIVDPELELRGFTFIVLRHDGDLIVRRSYTSLQLTVVRDEVDVFKVKEQ